VYRRLLTSVIGVAACIFAGLGAPQMTLGARPAAEPELVFGGLGGTYQTTWEKVVIPAFERKYHVKVSYVVPGLDAQIVARLRAGGANAPFDLVALGQNSVLEAGDQGLLAKLNVHSLPNLKYVYPLFWKPFDGYAVGTDVTPEGIGWNTQDVSGSLSSWKDLWRPDLKGKIALPDISHSLELDFIAMTALLNGGAVKHNKIVTVNNVSKAFAALKRLRPSVKQFYTSSFDGNTDLQTKQADVIVTYQGRIQSLKDGGFPARWVAPKEGIWPSLATISVPKGSRHLALAEKFINFFLTARMQSAYNASLEYAPVELRAQLPASIASKVAHGRKLFNSFLFLNYRQINKVLPKWTDTWNREIAPSP
jgi:putative spermidine/putrescine transport system substrate-binding protein